MRPATIYKPFTKDEVEIILALWEEGHSAREISKVVDRTKGSIDAFLYTERKTGKYTKQFGIIMGDSTRTEKYSPKKMAQSKTEAAPAAVVNPHKEEAPPHKDDVKPEVKAKEMTPREMIKKLYNLGYRIENNQLVCYVKQTVKIQDIING